MDSLWNPIEAQAYQGDLALRVYSSRLLGQEPALVMHGGGNTSVKIQASNLLGEIETLLYVKGSGWDLATIEAAGFAPVQLNHLLKLARLPRLSDPDMVNELKTHLSNASAPTPSVEAILHAILPYKYVDHTHADAVITVTNTRQGLNRIRDIYGDQVVVIPYVMPGFDLARLVAEIFPQQVTARTVGMVLMNHGIFSFGEDAKTSYERMIDLVNRAEQYLHQQGAWDIACVANQKTPVIPRQEIGAFRHTLSQVAGFPCILNSESTQRDWGFSQRDDLARISQQGPATPDHVIRTKRVPLVGRNNLSTYAEQYQMYVHTHAAVATTSVTPLDPAPRVVLDPEWGLITVGKTAQEACIVRDIYQHTIDIILRAEQLGGYMALSPQDIFAVEYWDLEQAKLRQGGTPPPLQGEIALITGAASGIGKACVQAFLKRGAAVIGLDIDPRVSALIKHHAFLGVVADISDVAAVEQALDRGVQTFGGIDMLVLNAGVFPIGCALGDLTFDKWRHVMNINLDANFMLMQRVLPLLRQAPRYGRCVVIGSKNVVAPGPGVAAYSASKTALTQLARVAALEWAPYQIRVNTLHPDAVYDTGIWTQDVLETRARHYGMSVAEYKTRNLLKTEISSADVAAMAVEMCGPLFHKITGAQIPIDGGNDRVI